MNTATVKNDRSEQFRLLTETSRGTPMGTLLRKFWHPIALSRELTKGQARPIRILNQEATLYRGESGEAYLVGPKCAHRLTTMHTGWVQDETIRCMYHGWRYTGAGKCVEMPAERSMPPGGVSIPSYPVREYCGMIFGYFGDGPPPDFDLLRKDAFERPNAILFARSETWNCNWFQQVENSLDALHVSFVHQWGRVGNFGHAVAATMPQLEYEETDSGIRQTARRSANNVRISDWTFPNANHIVVPGLRDDDPWIDVGHWVVPNDDTTTTRMMIYAMPEVDAEATKRIMGYFEAVADYNPADHHDELFNEKRAPNDILLPLTSAQDYVAAMGQGTIADRVDERLAGSDAGIALLRRIFWREMDCIVEQKGSKQWKRLARSVELPRQNAAADA